MTTQASGDSVIALDANVLLRYLLNDEPKQAGRSCALLASGSRFWVPITVMFEIAWVLRSHGADADAVALGLRTILGLATVTVQERDAVVRALAWHQHGMGMADALHLALSHQSERFTTFDKDLIKVAKRIGAQPAVGLP